MFDFLESINNIQLPVWRRSAISPLSLLYASVGNFILLNLSGYYIPASPGIHFVALRCTFSIVLMSLTECGAQTWFAYSRSGLASVLYKLKNVLSSR